MPKIQCENSFFCTEFCTEFCAKRLSAPRKTKAQPSIWWGKKVKFPNPGQRTEGSGRRTVRAELDLVPVGSEGQRRPQRLQRISKRSQNHRTKNQAGLRRKSPQAGRTSCGCGCGSCERTFLSDVHIHGRFSHGFRSPMVRHRRRLGWALARGLQTACGPGHARHDSTARRSRDTRGDSRTPPSSA